MDSRRQQGDVFRTLNEYNEVCPSHRPPSDDWDITAAVADSSTAPKGPALDARGNEVPIIALSLAALNNFGHLIWVKWESCLSC